MVGSSPKQDAWDPGRERIGVCLDLLPSRKSGEVGGLSGLDFAYTDNTAVYHTKNDKLELLSPGSLQHLGENMLPFLLQIAVTRSTATGSKIMSSASQLVKVFIGGEGADLLSIVDRARMTRGKGPKRRRMDSSTSRVRRARKKADSVPAKMAPKKDLLIDFGESVSESKQDRGLGRSRKFLSFRAGFRILLAVIASRSHSQYEFLDKD